MPPNDQSNPRAGVHTSAEGCDVRLEIDDGEECDVRAVPTVQDAIDALEEEENHAMRFEAWLDWLCRVSPGHLEPPPPRKVCLAEPGTEAKIRALADRLAAPTGLWHPGDMRRDQYLDHSGRTVSRGRNGQGIAGELRAMAEPEAEEALLSDGDRARIEKRRLRLARRRAA